MTGTTPAPGSSRPLRYWMVVGGILLLVGLLLWVFLPRFGEDPREIQTPLIGATVTAMQLDYLDGTGSASFGELRGRTLVVNFWASWCPECRTEHGELLVAQEAFRERGVQFVGILYQDTVAAARLFLDEFGWGEGLLYLVDSGSRAAVEFGVWGVPESFVVDADGRIVHKFTGAVDFASLSAVLDEVLESGTG